MDSNFKAAAIGYAVAAARPHLDNWLSQFTTWLTQRALRLPSKQAAAITRATGLPVGAINDAVAGAAAAAVTGAVTAEVDKVLPAGQGEGTVTP